MLIKECTYKIFSQNLVLSNKIKWLQLQLLLGPLPSPLPLLLKKPLNEEMNGSVVLSLRIVVEPNYENQIK